MKAISRMVGEIYAVYTKLPSRNCFESRKISHLNILLSNCSPRGGAFLLSEATKVASETAAIIWKKKNRVAKKMHQLRNNPSHSSGGAYITLVI